MGSAATTDRRLVHQKIYFFLSCAIVFILPLHERYTNIAIVLFALNWIIEGHFKEKARLLKKNFLALTFIGFYGIYLLGLIYTSNFDYAFLDLQIKLPLLLFPLILISARFTERQAYIIENVFITACLVAFTCCMGNAFYKYFYRGIKEFTYIPFSIIMHPGYLSLSINMAVIILLNRLCIRENFSFNKQWWEILAIAALVGFAVMLLARIGVVTVFFSVMAFGSAFIIKRLGLAKGGVILTITIITSFYSISTIPNIKARMNQTIDAIQSELENPDFGKKQEETVNSSQARIYIWQSAWVIIKKNPIIGVGTGDVRDALQESYKENGLMFAIKRRLNSHNQYIQTTVTLGFMGLMGLLACLTFGFLKGIRSKDWIYIGFLGQMALFFLTDSFIEIQVGAVFFSFFNSFLAFRHD